VHPKIHATVQKAVDLWEDGEKVLVFAFYRHTCRAFPIHQHDELEPDVAVRSMLNSQDASGLSWREKFRKLLEFLLRQCSPQERLNYLEAAERTQTGRIRVQASEVPDDAGTGQEAVLTLANVQVATGETERSTGARLMRAFNTPFFPDILVCRQVMGEGVDLHRYCRHVIHHDLDWNPSSIEQRTGRVNRLGCKAKNRHPIPVSLPYLAGTADERQYRVMTDRESWFRIVMGQEEVARIIPIGWDKKAVDTEKEVMAERNEEQLAKLIKDLRRKLGPTQEQFAAKSG